MKVSESMPTYPFLQVDAFTDRPLGGNPCAIVLDADDLDADVMQAIAREMNLSETAFVLHSSVADFGVRYFTPTEEIPLAGHPTIATTFALVHTGRQPLSGELTRISLELRVGPIAVDIFAAHGAVSKIVMTQKKPAFLKIHQPADVLPAFGLTEDDLLPGVPIQTVSTGTPQLMIPLRDHEALRHIQVDARAYEHLRASADFFSPHLFCLGGATEAGQTFARHIVPMMEDPATGSATGGMGAYLWHYGLIEQSAFIAEQGHWMNRPSQMSVEVIGSREEIAAVKVGGGAAVVLQGELTL